MKAFLPFIVVPAIIGGGVMVSPWLANQLLAPIDAVEVPQMTALPPGTHELIAATRDGAVEPPRLLALMPAGLVDQVLPPPPSPIIRPAAERYRLASVLLAEGKRSAVINDSVVFEGNRLDEYRVARIANDRVVLAGPRGTETVPLGAPPALVPRAAGAARGGSERPPPPADELERQFRRLLENFSL